MFQSLLQLTCTTFLLALASALDLGVIELQPLHSPNPCHEDDSVLVLVHSYLSRTEHRRAIRSTWSRQDGYRRVFLLASTGESGTDEVAREEGSTFGDVLLLDFHESYRNLTLKHASGYHWAIQNCPNVSYILKTDDDTFVDTYSLGKYIQAFQLSASDSFILCLVHKNESPIRDPDGLNAKWFLSTTEYARDKFPFYCSGSAYVTTMPVVQTIFAKLPDIPFLFIDDVLMTGLAIEGDQAIDLLDWGEAFLSHHEDDRPQLLDPAIGFYSPLLMVAMNLKPVEIEILQQKAELCARHESQCYDLLYKTPDINQYRPPKMFTPLADDRAKYEL